MISMKEYKERREALMSFVEQGSLLLIPSAKEVIRNGADNVFEFRQNSDFLYLTGFNEPDAVLALLPGRDEGEVILFNRVCDPAAEIWTGKRAGQEGACRDLGVDQAFEINQFKDALVDLMQNCSQVYYPLARNTEFDLLVLEAFSSVRSKVRRGISAPEQFCNVEPLLHALRLRKSDAELELMQQVNTISGEAHVKLMQACRPGMSEYQLEAIFRAHCCQAGCRGLAYPPIVAAGKNSCTLHYVENSKLVKDGDLVLVDAGGELHGYAADITRTFPANGRFSPEQKAVYNVVLAAQQAVFDMIKPGLYWNELQATAARVITQGLVELGLLQGPVDVLLEERAYQAFYMHQPAHWLGLDVHDVGAYCHYGDWQRLEEGMVLTVEPGIYIQENTPGVDKRWWNIGIRIEDDVVVTCDGMHNLTAAVPKTVDEIEALMSHG